MSRIGAISSHSISHTNRSKNSDSFRNKRVSQQQIEQPSNHLNKTPTAWKKDRAIYSATSCKTSATQVKKGIERRNGRLSKQAFSKENSTSRTSFRSSSLVHSNRKGEGASANSLESSIGVKESVERSDKNIIIRRKDVASRIFNPTDLEQLKFHLTPKSIEDFLSSKEYQEWKTNAIHNSLETQSLIANETSVIKPLQKPNKTVQNLAEAERNQVKTTAGNTGSFNKQHGDNSLMKINKLKCIIL